jgi:radical SAM superfamily enzyme YgiQ (UPF0313 family)
MPTIPSTPSRETARAAIETGPDVIGLTSTTGIIDIVITIAGLIKEERPDIPIVLGGPHISAVRQEVLRHASVDFAVFGEGEASFLELLACIRREGHPRMSPDIAYRDGATLHANPAREHITDLDGLPMPMWDLFDCTDYHDFLIHGEDPYIILTTSRRMPLRLHILRLQDHLGKEGPVLQPEYVVQELADLAARGIHNFTFVDDTFTLNKRRLKAICQGIIERDIRATFMCSSRVETPSTTKQPTSLRGRAAQDDHLRRRVRLREDAEGHQETDTSRPGERSPGDREECRDTNPHELHHRLPG